MAAFDETEIVEPGDLDQQSNMNQCQSPGLEDAAAPNLEDYKDQLAWAQYLLDTQSCFNSPRGDLGGFPDLGVLCPSPLLSDQLKYLQSFNSRANHSDSVSTTSVSCKSEPGSSELKLVSGTESTMAASGSNESTICSGNDAVSMTRKRKSSFEDPEEESKDAVLVGDDQSQHKESNPALKKTMKGEKRVRGPRIAIKTRTDVDNMQDGYKWRKYGQKPVKNSPHPRNYYRCTTAGCPVRKRVERSTEDSGIFITSYEGIHIHPKTNLHKPASSSGSYGYELEGSLGQHSYRSMSRPQQPATESVAPRFAQSQVPNLGQFWRSSQQLPGRWPLMNRQQQLPGVPSVENSMNLFMAYHLLRMQWEWQSRAQQFMSFNAQEMFAGATAAAAQPQNLYNIDPAAQGFSQASGVQPFSDIDSLMQSNLDCRESEQFEPQFQPRNETLSSLLWRRTNALRTRDGDPNIPNLQYAIKAMQQGRQMSGRQHYRSGLGPSCSPTAPAVNDQLQFCSRSPINVPSGPSHWFMTF